MKSLRTCLRGRKRSGFGLIEAMISVGILAVLLSMFGHSLASVARSHANVEAVSRLETYMHDALEEVRGDLFRSGRVTRIGSVYPYLFDGGVAEAPFDVHGHAPAVKAAKDGEFDFGVDREIVYVLPADADGDGIPDLDAQGDLVWDAHEYSYVVNTDATGVNWLERRVDGAEPRRIVPFVERVTFDDAFTSGAVVPLGAVRVRLWFRLNDGSDHPVRRYIETTVRLRNG